MNKKFLTILVSVVLVVMLAVSSVSATTQTTSHERGVMYLSWSRNTVTWKYNSTGITSSDAWQQANAVFLALGGWTKLNQSTSASHYYNFTTIMHLGVIINGISIGPAEYHIDQCVVAKTGFNYWTIDIG